MLATPFTTGVSFYVFYALQPFLLKLYGNEKAYSIAGLVAAIAALAQIAGGLGAHQVNRLFKKRTTALFISVLVGSAVLFAVSHVASFFLALLLIFFWGLTFAALSPIRMAYINGLIPSAQRATVLSFDSLMGSSGGVLVQPVLGKAADLAGYPFSYAIASLFQVVALPFIFLAKREKAKSDRIE
jgi:MFS family permease